MANTCPVLSAEMPDLGGKVAFPSHIPIQESFKNKNYDLDDLDFFSRQQLRDICDQDLITFTELSAGEREILWEKRFYLRQVAGALPKVLLSAHSWEYSSLPGLYGLLHGWRRPEAMDILQVRIVTMKMIFTLCEDTMLVLTHPVYSFQLFMPCFPDTQVRQCAVEWLAQIHSDELLDYLPQLLEALKHETYSSSPLARLLLQRSLDSPRIAHNLYWLLRQSLPGEGPQNTSGNGSGIRVARYQRRLQTLLRALYTIGGSAMRNSFCAQQELLRELYTCAAQVQSAHDSQRSRALKNAVGRIDAKLKSEGLQTAVPLSPSLVASGIQVESCSYFNSKTLPLKISFESEDQKPFNVIFKIGDDLRQDMLTMQMIRVMDKMWLADDLDLKMVTFSCVPTGDKQGMMEMVSDSKTLREIQVGTGNVTGSFKVSLLH